MLRSVAGVQGDGPLAPAARRRGEGDRRRPSTRATSACPACCTRGSCARPRTARRSRSVDTSRGRRSIDGVTVVERGRAGRRAARRSGGRRGRPRTRAARSGRRPRRRRQDGIFDDLLGRAPAPEVKGTRGRRRGGPRRRGPALRQHLPQGLRRPRADGAAHRDGGDQGRQAHGLGLDADARSRRAIGSRRRSRSRPEERPRHHAVRRRRASAARAPAARPRRRRGWRRSPAARCRWPGRAPRSSSTTPSTRPAIVKITLGRRRRREDHALGLRRLLRGRPRRGALLRRPQRPHAGLRRLAGRGTDAHRFGVGPWRAPGANMNVFARESQIDVMAAGGRRRPGRVPPPQHRATSGCGACCRRRRRRSAGSRRRPRAAAASASPAASTPARYAALVAEVEGGPRERGGQGRARRLRPGHGDRRESRRGDDAGRGLHHDGPRLRAHARSCASAAARSSTRTSTRYELPRFSWLPADRDRAREERRARAAGRRRAGDRPDGRRRSPTPSSTRPAPGSSGCR